MIHPSPRRPADPPRIAPRQHAVGAASDPSLASSGLLRSCVLLGRAWPPADVSATAAPSWPHPLLWSPRQCGARSVRVFVAVEDAIQGHEAPQGSLHTQDHLPDYQASSSGAGGFTAKEGLARLVGMDESKRKVFDRQLRIWGEHGQQRLLDAKVCLLGCGPAGTETLKNLVLGGIGSFTVVDQRKVTEADLGNNFLVEREHLGQSLAGAATKCLSELNERCHGNFVEEHPVKLVTGNEGFFKAFTLVVAADLHEPELCMLDACCRSHGVPLLGIRSYGLVGLVRWDSSTRIAPTRELIVPGRDDALSVRVCLRPSLEEHCVVEAKPDNVVLDMRVVEPWPQLQEFAFGFDLESLPDNEHSHVPWLILLIKALEAWRREKESEMTSSDVPRTSADKAELKAVLKKLRRNVDQQNFKEALGNAYHVRQVLELPSATAQLPY
eukprot:scaffold2551_cov376-Prasinococcus_capsulatus_cf.AAC.9